MGVSDDELSYPSSPPLNFGRINETPPIPSLLVASVIVSVALSLATASPVLAEPKDPSHDKVLIAHQGVFDDFSSSIEKNPGLIQAGYIASFHDVENRALEVKWHNMPAKVQADLTSQATELGVKLTIVSSKFSRDELGRAHAAVQSQGQTLRSLGFDLIGLSDINRDDDGFVALMKPSGGLPANASMKAASMLKGANDIPVSLKEANVVAAATRTVDFPNFAAGGFIAPVGRPAGPVGIAAAKGDSGGPVLTYRTDGRAVCCPNLPPP